MPQNYTSNFCAVSINDLYIDKSLLIAEVLQKGGVVSVTRPKHWGKTLNLNMLHTFLAAEVDEEGTPLAEESRQNTNTFTRGVVDAEKGFRRRFRIGENEDIIDRQGQNPVIYLDLERIKGNTYEEIKSRIAEQIQIVFTSYPYLKRHNITSHLSAFEAQELDRYLSANLSEVDIENSLLFLSKLLFQIFNKAVYVLIDEYDTPITNAYLKFGALSRELEYLQSLLGNTFNSLFQSEFVKGGLITGVLPISVVSDNITYYTVFEKDFSRFYGFTHEEVMELLTKVPTRRSPKEIEAWYMGYNYGQGLYYNTRSIVQCLQHESQLSQWIHINEESTSDEIFSSDYLQEQVQYLAQGNSIIGAVPKEVSLGNLWSRGYLSYNTLVYEGYLNAIPVKDHPLPDAHSLQIPNQEIRSVFVGKIRKWTSSRLGIGPDEFDGLLVLLRQGDVLGFGKFFQKYFSTVKNLQHENEYLNIIGGIVLSLSLSYTIKSKRDAYNGRCIHLVIPPSPDEGDQAIEIDCEITMRQKMFKVVMKSVSRRMQVPNNDTILHEYGHVSKLLRIGMTFFATKVHIKHRIENLPQHGIRTGSEDRMHPLKMHDYAIDKRGKMLQTHHPPTR